MPNVIGIVFANTRKGVPHLCDAVGENMKYFLLSQFVLLSVICALQSQGSLENSREVASMKLPMVASTTNVGDIIDTYEVYLDFVCDSVKDSNPEQSKKLKSLFTKLKKKDEKAAARFLKGLRFEITQKVEFMSVGRKDLSSNSTLIQSWAKRYMANWIREADEQLFRAEATITYKD